MTDVRETSSSLILGPELDGRFYVRNAKRNLVAELYKPGGRTVEIGLEPGAYSVQYDRGPQLFGGSLSLASGERRTLAESSLQIVKRSATQKRGAEAPEDGAQGGLKLVGRTRAEVGGGFTDSFSSVAAGEVSAQVSGGQAVVGIVHWIREDVALDFQVAFTDIAVETANLAPAWGTSQSSGSMGVLFGARYYFPRATFGGTLRPFVSGAIGPFTHYDVSTGVTRTEVKSNATRFGGQIAGGVDLQFTRLLSLGTKAEVTLRDNTEAAFGLTFTLGFAWGKGRKQS
jgi:hypothetical protein